MPSSTSKSLPSVVVESGMLAHEPGTVLDGKYELVRVLGAGGMGMVYEAKHLRLQQRVAIKILHPAIAHRDDLVRRFEREARATARLTDPHIIEIFDVDVSADGTPYMVLEYLEGRDLGREIEERGRLDPSYAADLMLQAATGMADAHAHGIVHRDLKPSNLFLVPIDPREGRYFVKVVDFGISHDGDDQDGRLTATRNLLGTPLYMSPEQIRTPQLVDPRADIWSLGMILYECLTGRLPFNGTVMQIAASVVSDSIPVPSIHGPTIPPGLERVLMRMLRRDASERYANCNEVIEALQPFAPAAPASTRLRRIATPSVAFSEEARMRALAQIEPILAARAAAARAVSPHATTEARIELPVVPAPRRTKKIVMWTVALASCAGGSLLFWPGAHGAAAPVLIARAAPPPSSSSAPPVDPPLLGDEKPSASASSARSSVGSAAPRAGVKRQPPPSAASVEPDTTPPPPKNPQHL